MMIPFGEIIGILRTERKISQAQLAEKVGLKSSSTVASYEAGMRFPSLPTLIKIARYFGVTTDYLLGVSKTKEVFLDTSGLTPQQIESLNLIIENYRECNAASSMEAKTQS